MPLAHTVFFSLHDPSPRRPRQARQGVPDLPHRPPRLVYFACGVLTPDLARPVNDRDFDVALHTVFATREDHDVYQTAPRHLQFIEENKADWAKSASSTRTWNRPESAIRFPCGGRPPWAPSTNPPPTQTQKFRSS